MIKGMILGIVDSGISYLRSLDHQILMEEQPDLSFMVQLVADHHSFYIDTFALVNPVIHMQFYAKPFMPCHNIGYQGVLDIIQLEHPLRLVKPAEDAINPDAETAMLSPNMIKLTDVRIVNIADITILIQI
ncbi:hypothetical protein D3C80_1433490 [compost metagenome]